MTDKKLTNEEYNILMLISNKAKMDWFNIEIDDSDNFYVFDYEENKKLDLKTGILMLNEGLIDIDNYDLLPPQKEIYHDLIRKVLEGEYGK